MDPRLLRGFEFRKSADYWVSRLITKVKTYTVTGRNVKQKYKA